MYLDTAQRRSAAAALALLALATAVALGNMPRLIDADAAEDPKVPVFYAGVVVTGMLAGLVTMALHVPSGARVLLRVAGLFALLFGLVASLACLDRL